MKKLDYAASYQTLRISTKRFDRSPFLENYATPEMVFGVYAGRLYPLSLGEDSRQRYWSLRRQVVLFDVPERPVAIEGPDAAALLERVLARRISNLKVGRARYAIACTPGGGVLMDGVLIRLAQNRFWYVKADGEFDAWLIAHAQGLDVKISDPSSWVLQVQGPKSLAVLRAASGGAIDEAFGYFHAGRFDLGGQRLLVSRTGWTGELGFEIYTQGQATDAAALWDHLIQHGEPHGMVFSSLEAMGTRRLEAGILDNGQDMDPSMTPFQAGLGRFVDLGKPNFIGRAALLQADKRTLLLGLSCADAVPFAGAEVLDGADVVGRMTVGAWSPYLGRGIGYARFVAAGEWLGRTLWLRTRDGRPHACHILELPFYDPDKRIPRGLDRCVPNMPE